MYGWGNTGGGWGGGNGKMLAAALASPVPQRVSYVEESEEQCLIRVNRGGD